MPIMQASEVPEQFDDILFWAVLTLVSVYASLGVITNLAFGDMKGIQAITMALPQDSILVKSIMVLMIGMMIFSYPICIYPTNLNLEKYTIDKWMKGKNKTLIYWMKNMSRLTLCALTAYMAIELQNVLDLFIGLFGAICCGPVAMIIPTLCHLKLLAKTNREKIEDIIIVAIGSAVMVFCVVTILFK